MQTNNIAPKPRFKWHLLFYIPLIVLIILCCIFPNEMKIDNNGIFPLLFFFK